MSTPFALRVVLLIVALIAVYALIQVILSRHTSPLRASVAAVIAWGLLLALYATGGYGSPILGHGEGALAAGTFLGLSLVVAGVRADPGCEVMSIPALLFRQHSELACFIFSPLDSLERKLRRSRAPPAT